MISVEIHRRRFLFRSASLLVHLSQFTIHHSLFIFCVLAILAPATPVIAADPDDAAFHDLVSELRAVESQISARLREQSGHADQLQALDQSLRVTDEFLAGNQKVRVESRKALEALHESAQRGFSAMDQVESASRRDLADAEAAISMAAPLALLEARARGVADVRSFTFALLEMGHRRRAHALIEHGLRLEELKLDREARQEKIDEQAEFYASLAQLSLEQLRLKRLELSRRASQLHIVPEEEDAGLRSLQSRHEALSGLLANPAAGAPREEEAPESDRMPADQSSKAQPEPISPSEGTQSPRQSFWSATASAIHSLVAGKVVFSGPVAGYRHLLILDHGGGFTSLYGNMSQCDLREGSNVAQGETVGIYSAGGETTPGATDAEKSATSGGIGQTNRGGGKAEEFWIEVRLEAKPVPIEQLPGVKPGWERVLFGDKAPASHGRPK